MKWWVNECSTNLIISEVECEKRIYYPYHRMARFNSFMTRLSLAMSAVQERNSNNNVYSTDLSVHQDEIFGHSFNRLSLGFYHEPGSLFYPREVHVLYLQRSSPLKTWRLSMKPQQAPSFLWPFQYCHPHSHTRTNTIIKSTVSGVQTPGWEPVSEIFNLGSLGKLLKLSSSINGSTNNTHSSSCYEDSLRKLHI